MSDSERSMRDGADPAEGEMSEDDMQAYNDSEYSDFANEEDEEDELVDEIDEAEIQPETNRRSRRAPLRVKLTRRAPAAASSETRRTLPPRKTTSWATRTRPRRRPTRQRLRARLHARTASVALRQMSWSSSLWVRTL